MARAESASASAHSDSIKGLAQAVARPAYRRLLTAEPFLRRAVPVLIIAFLVDARRRGGRRYPRTAAARRSRNPQTSSISSRPSWRSASSALRTIETGDACDARPSARSTASTGRAPRRAAGSCCSPTRSSTIIATQPALNGYVGRKLNEAIGRDPPLTLRSAIRPASPRSRSPTASNVLLAQRILNAPLGQIAVMQRAQRRCSATGAPTPRSRHAVLGDRLRRADARLRLPVAIAPDARDRQHRRHRAQPHRHRAQPRPLRAVGLGPRERARVLVALDVRHSRPAAARRAA